MKSEIKLCKYDSKYDTLLKQFTLPEEQAQYTGMPFEIIELAKKDSSRFPIVIVNHSHPVGFFALCSGELVSEYTSNKNALLLIAFSINYSEQGKGYAKEGLKQLKEYVDVNFHNKSEVILAVNCKNIPAQRLYEKVGFKDTDRRRVGRNGEQKILSLSI